MPTIYIDATPAQNVYQRSNPHKPALWLEEKLNTWATARGYDLQRILPPFQINVADIIIREAWDGRKYVLRIEANDYITDVRLPYDLLAVQGAILRVAPFWKV